MKRLLRVISLLLLISACFIFSCKSKNKNTKPITHENETTEVQMPRPGMDNTNRTDSIKYELDKKRRNKQ